MKMLRVFSYIIWGVLLSTILLLIFVKITAFNLNHYKKSFIKYNIVKATSMDNENLEYIINDVLEYLRDDRKILNTKITIGAEEKEIFGGREKLHMMDVKELFAKGRFLLNICTVLFIIMGLLFIKRDRHWKKSIANILLYTAAANILLLFMLLLLIKIDFDKYFIYFHTMFFNNDFWILDFNTDILIRMLPEEFFYHTTVKIVSHFIVSSAVLGLSGLYFTKKQATETVNR